MRFIAFFSLCGAATASAIQMSGDHSAYLALKSVIERQTLCKPVTAPYTCERSCGAGYTQCISFPNCYNPGAGEVCCSNGKYCPKGYYCTNAGCCPNGTPLAQCGATVTLSIILPGTSATGGSVSSTSTAADSSTTTSKSSSKSSSTTSSKPSSTSVTTTKQSSSTHSKTHSKSTSTSTQTTAAPYPTASKPTTTSSKPIATGAPTNTTNTTTASPSPTFATAGADKNIIINIMPVVGGLLVFWLAL